MSHLPGATFPPLQRSLQILVVDDEMTIRGPLALCLETLGHRVVEAATPDEALAAARRSAMDLALVDLRLGTASGMDLVARLLSLLPRLKIIIITAYGSVDVAVRAMTRGAADFLCKPFTPDQVAQAVARAASLTELESDVGMAPDRSGTAGPTADFATTSAALQDAVATARRAAPSDTPILIGGEPGTGKAVLARAIHGWSRTPEGPFVGMDCATHSSGYIDLALFGDTLAGDQLVRGDQPPLALLASGGTILIKHLELMSMASQERLARLIETHRFEPHSGTPSACDCRIVATTNQRNRAELSRTLAMLLERVHVALPPLRERADDIPLLAQRYLAFSRERTNKQVLGFSVEAIDRLQSYKWPENLRELRAAVEEACAAADADYIQVHHLPEKLRSKTVGRRPRAGDPVSLRDLEMAHVREVLASQESLQQAADVLGLDLQALYRRRKQFGLE